MSYIQIRISEEEKKEAQLVLASMGLTLSSGIKLFLRKTIQEKKMPFNLVAGNTSLEKDEKKNSSQESFSGGEIRSFKNHAIGS